MSTNHTLYPHHLLKKHLFFFCFYCLLAFSLTALLCWVTGLIAALFSQRSSVGFGVAQCSHRTVLPSCTGVLLEVLLLLPAECEENVDFHVQRQTHVFLSVSYCNFFFSASYALRQVSVFRTTLGPYLLKCAYYQLQLLKYWFQIRMLIVAQSESSWDHRHFLLVLVWPLCPHGVLVHCFLQEIIRPSVCVLACDSWLESPASWCSSEGVGHNCQVLLLRYISFLHFTLFIYFLF